MGCANELWENNSLIATVADDVLKISNLMQQIDEWSSTTEKVEPLPTAFSDLPNIRDDDNICLKIVADSSRLALYGNQAFACVSDSVPLIPLQTDLMSLFLFLYREDA